MMKLIVDAIEKALIFLFMFSHISTFKYKGCSFQLINSTLYLFSTYNSKIMEEKMLKELVKSRNILKKKFQSLKMGEEATSSELQNTFKPLTEPLLKLVKLTNDNVINLTKPKSESSIIPTKSVKESPITSTPKKRVVKKEVEGRSTLKNYFDFQEDGDDSKDVDDVKDDTFYSQGDDDGDVNLSYLKRNKKLDVVFGPHKDAIGEWKFGNDDLKVTDEKIIIGNQHWAKTPGLFELIFYQSPKNYDASELNIYKKILLNTNAHRVNYDPNGRVKANKGIKYREIIKNLFVNTHTGKGLMRVNLQKPSYIYWDDPNELVDRLKLLIASQHAGNNNQTNEIVSIIEELREADIIE